MIVATAGHVDHGKTSLVRNLTGVDTDRLEEEKRRGLSISLGYAYWHLDENTSLGFIDVPGHRRFINTMISGVSGIDLGMLVVAADDGPMPQTREHMQVMELLGVEHYLLVVSKCDRVDEEQLQRVCVDASALLPANTRKYNTPIYKVSNTAGTGIDELRTDLERMARDWTARRASGHFRMSVDRAFNLQGHGLIVTGTIQSGKIANGEALVLHPQGKVIRVRGIHAQDRTADVGVAGERCALNIVGDIHKNEIERGDWLANESGIDPTTRFDTRIRLLPEAAFALKHLSSIKLHIGAKHLEARLMLLQDEDSKTSRLNPGETVFAQLVTEQPVLCYRGDRFLIRDYGETATLGGGIVLDPDGPKYRKSSRSRLEFLAAMEQDNIEDAIVVALEIDQEFLNYDSLLASWNVNSGDKPGSELPGIARIGTPRGELWLKESLWAKLKEGIIENLLALHESAETAQGVKPTRLMTAALSAREQPFFQSAVAELIKEDLILIKDGLLYARACKSFQVAEEIPHWSEIRECLEHHGYQVPTVALLEKECEIEKRNLLYSLGRAERAGHVLKINAKRYALVSTLREFAQAALNLTEDETKFSLADLRDRLGCGRNIALDVLEYFDAIRFTQREGELRTIPRRQLPRQLANE